MTAIVLGYDASESANAALGEHDRRAPQLGRRSSSCSATTSARSAGRVGRTFRPRSSASAEHAVARAVADLRAAGIEVETRLVSGKPADAILDVAEEVGAAAIVVGTVGENPITGALLGSVVLRLVQRSPLPLLVVPMADE